LRTVRAYRSERREHETFYNWARRNDNDRLLAILADDERAGLPG